MPRIMSKRRRTTWKPRPVATEAATEAATRAPTVCIGAYNNAVVTCNAHPDAPVHANTRGDMVCSVCFVCMPNNVSDTGRDLTRMRDDKVEGHWGMGGDLTTRRSRKRRTASGTPAAADADGGADAPATPTGGDDGFGYADDDGAVAAVEDENGDHPALAFLASPVTCDGSPVQPTTSIVRYMTPDTAREGLAARRAKDRDAIRARIAADEARLAAAAARHEPEPLRLQELPQPPQRRPRQPPMANVVSISTRPVVAAPEEVEEAKVASRDEELQAALTLFATHTCERALRASTATAAVTDDLMATVRAYIGPAAAEQFCQSRLPNLTQFATPERGYVVAIAAAAVATQTSLGNRNNFDLTSAPLVAAALAAYTETPHAPWKTAVAPPPSAIIINNSAVRTITSAVDAVRASLDTFLADATHGQTTSYATHVRTLAAAATATAAPPRLDLRPMDITAAAPTTDEDDATDYLHTPKYTPSPDMDKIVLTHPKLATHTEWLPAVVDAVTKLYVAFGVPPAAVAAGAITHGVDRGAHLACLLHFAHELRTAAHGLVTANNDSFVLMAAILWWAAHVPPGMPSPVELQPTVAAAAVVKYCPLVGAAMQTLCTVFPLNVAKFRLSQHEHIRAAHAKLGFPAGLLRHLL